MPGDIYSRRGDRVLRLVNDRHFEALGVYFGKTILGFFTDEPSPMGRGARKNAVAWTRGFADFFQCANECFGAYGWEFTEEEMWWITNWLFMRGTDLLMPYAFYYSLRDKRRDERPPDVGLNSPWWSRYKVYAATAVTFPDASPTPPSCSGARRKNYTNGSVTSFT